MGGDDYLIWMYCMGLSVRMMKVGISKQRKQMNRAAITINIICHPMMCTGA
jgi:hypothetical protein